MHSLPSLTNPARGDSIAPSRRRTSQPSTVTVVRLSAQGRARWLDGFQEGPPGQAGHNPWSHLQWPFGTSSPFVERATRRRCDRPRV
eukprot:976634-Pyramimonas_sp.AAC.1